MKLIIADVDLGKGKNYVVSRAFLKRLQEYLENDVPLPELPRSRTPHETDTKQICPSCFGSGELHTIDHARLVCNRCNGTGHI